MKIDVASEKILVIKDQVSDRDAEALAWDKKISAFGTISQVAGFFARPKDEDFELVYSEHRYEPFWHVLAKARYVYDRKATYLVPVTGKVVQSVTLLKTLFEVASGQLHLDVMEHCIQEEIDEVYIDGITSKNITSLANYTNYSHAEVKGKIENSLAKNSLIIPPSARISAIMRDSLAKMIKGIQADVIHEEHVEVSTVELYYHPIYAYKFKWHAKGKEGIIEVDGVTGEVKSGARVFSEYFGKVLDQDFLFDIGADAAGMIVPGGSIAVKAARKYMSNK